MHDFLLGFFARYISQIKAVLELFFWYLPPPPKKKRKIYIMVVLYPWYPNISIFSAIANTTIIIIIYNIAIIISKHYFGKIGKISFSFERTCKRNRSLINGEHWDSIIHYKYDHAVFRSMFLSRKRLTQRKRCRAKHIVSVYVVIQCKIASSYILEWMIGGVSLPNELQLFHSTTEKTAWYTELWQAFVIIM